MNNTQDSQPPARPPFAALDGSVTFLKCDHVGWGMNAILMTPAVAIACAAAVAWQPGQFLAGCMLGVWVSMWLVVLWAWLTRRQSPNAEVSDGGPLTHESTETRTRRSLH
jgi:hypothetical protein